MPNSLLTGVSGLLAHQRMLDVVGHNLANLNTTAYKTQRLIFADLLYETIQPATSAGEEGNAGGANPNQIGGGVKLATTDRNFAQGSLQSTGGQFDFAMNGPGFFTVSDGENEYYTRAGMFSVDEAGFLVAPGAMAVKRFSSVGDPDGINPGFQVPGDDRIRIPLGESIEGVISREIDLSGNLSASANPPIEQSLRTQNAFQTGGVAATETTLINDLDTIDVPYVDGDKIIIEGTQHDGSAQVFSEFTVTSTSTLQDLMDAIDAEFPGATISLEQGSFLLTADETGPSTLNVGLRNDSANVASGLAITSHQFQVDVEGEAAGTATAIVNVYDIQGGEHELTLKFEKKTDDSWIMNATLDPESGELIDSTIDNILFSDTGAFLGSGSPTITMQIHGIAVPQTITLNLDKEGENSGLSHFNSDSSLSAVADGSPPGVVTQVQIDATGEIKGVASNGKVFTVANLAIAAFSNPKGLVAQGDNLYSTSLNSGAADFGKGGTANRGTITGGQLEASNVDVAQEFTKLIVAQTGYNASARTITISAELLEELTNIVR